MLARLVSRFVEMRPGEGRAVARAFAYFFTLLSGYYVLRPIREEMGVQGGVKALPWLFTATFVTMLLAVPVYSWAVSRFPRRMIVPAVYRFFLANIVFFWIVFASGVLPEKSVALQTFARVFYVWTAVYNLFVVSVFWSVLADLFDSASAKRLFGFIAAGGTAGALAGPLLATWLTPFIGPLQLLLLSAAFLEASVRCMTSLHDAVPRDARVREERIGGGAFDGLADVARSPLLLAIALQTLLFACTSTFLYLRHQAIVSAALDDPTDRTQLFALGDFIVNAVALVLQTLATGAILSRYGVMTGLASVPVIGLIALPGLAISPSVTAVVLANSVRRGVHFGLQRPARETLFTAVPDREKYKAKSFIDTVVYRGADAVAGWIYAGLEALKLSSAALFLSALPFAAGGLVLGWFMARKHAQQTGDTQRRKEETETG